MHRNARRVSVVAILVALAAPAPGAAAASNRPPSCEGRILSVAPGGSRALPLSCTDTDGFPEQMTLTAGTAEHGTVGPVDHRNGTVRYTPAPGFTGVDHLTFRAADGAATSPAATHEIRVTGAQQAPVCAAGPFTAAASQWAGQPCYDPDETDAVEVDVVTEPQHGRLARSTDETWLTYVPAAGRRGPDTFTVRASDGTRTSADTEIAVEVTGPGVAECDPPAGPIPVRPGGAKRLGLHCHDDTWSWGTWTSFEEVEQPAHGTLRGVGYEWGYVPDAGYTGPDQAVIRPSNGTPGTPVTLHFDVRDGANEAPVCHPSPPAAGRPGRALPVAWCADPDDDPLTFTLVDPPGRGTFTAPAASGEYGRYTAAAGEGGADRFTFTATDGTATSAPVTQAVRVIGASENHAPICFGAAYLGFEDQAIVGGGSCIDEEGDPLTFGFTEPQHGTRTAYDGAAWWSYDPGDGFLGEDAFTQWASDGTATSAHAPVRLTVRPVAPPRCDDRPVRTVRSGIRTNLDVDCTSDAGFPAFGIVTQPEHGTLEHQGGGWFGYTPDPGYEGPDAFTVQASNAKGATPVTREVDVEAGFNTPPSCGWGGTAVTRQAPITLQLQCHDEEGDPYTRAITAPPAHGTLSAVDQDAGTVVYTPDAGHLGNDEFGFTATDDRQDASPEVTVRIVVRDRDRNGAPDCAGSRRMLQAGATEPTGIQCWDPDGDPVTLEVTDGPDFGTLGPVESGYFVYTPVERFTGTDRFTFVGHDGRGGTSAPATVILEVEGRRGPPTCSPVTFAATAGRPRAAQLACTAWGPGGPGMTIEIAGEPQHGTVGAPGPDGTVTYIADAGYEGLDTFTFRAREGDVTGEPVTATVNVTRPPADDRDETDKEPPPSGSTPPVPPAGAGAPAPAGGRQLSSGPAARDVAARALGGRAVFVRRIGAVRVYRRAAAGRRTTRLLALVCSRPACAATVHPVLELPGRVPLARQLLRFGAGRAGVVTLSPGRAQRRLLLRARRAAVRVAIAAGRARGAVRVRL